MDEYSREFRELLNGRLEAPKNKDEEEVTSLILRHETDIEEIQRIIGEVCTIHLSVDGKNFLQNYKETIEENLEWAKKLDSTHTSPNKKNEYRMLLSLSDQLVSELEEAVGESKELETIARRLQDAHLLAEVDYEEDQMQEMGEKLSGLMQRREKLESLMAEFENLENYVEEHRIVETLNHRQNVIETVLENAGEASEREKGNRKVFIGKEFLSNIQHAARNYNEEISGILVCRKEGKDWTVVKTLQTGIGTEGSVSPDTSRLQAANELIENYAKYRLVEFHTHSVGTVNRHGQQFARGWSETDIENFKDQGEGYIGMLVTPEKVLLRGNKGDPELETFDTESSSTFNKWREEFEREWSEIKSNYSFDTLPDPTEFDRGD